MPYHRRSRALLCALTALMLVAVLAPSGAGAHGPHPLIGERQWIDCTTGHLRGAAPYSVWPDLWTAQSAGRTDEVARLERIAHVPQAKWLAGRNVRSEPSRIIGTFVRNTLAPEWGGPNCRTHYDGREGAGDPFVGNYPVFALRQLEHDACSRSYDGGGSWNRVNGSSYLPWLEKFVDALAPIGHNATVIVEPDGLPVTRKCLSRSAARQRVALMRAVSKRLGGIPNLTTYLDIGSSGWLRKGPAKRLLRRAGVRYVRGFALNTTHFNYTRLERRYGNSLARALGKHYVINTAENGRGGLRNAKNPKDRFCNPVNAGLGALPTTRTGSKYADAFLWISRPGLSSNGHGGQTQCTRGPGGNVFWPPKAHQEARLAIFQGQPPWPPPPL
jgi:Glycosyl hydrolases family 6